MSDGDKSTGIMSTKAMQLPKGSDAAEALLKLSQDFKEMPFWIAKKPSRLARAGVTKDPRPEGTRPWPEAALMVYDEKHWKMGMMMLQYRDGYKVLVGIGELHAGDVFHAGEVTQKYVICQVGYTDMKQRRHEA